MFVDIVLDDAKDFSPLDPVFVENQNGRTALLGEWIRRPDGSWALRFNSEQVSGIEQLEPPDGPGWEDGFCRNH